MGAQENKLQKLQISQNEIVRMMILPVFSQQFIWTMASFYHYDQNPFRFYFIFNFGNSSKV